MAISVHGDANLREAVCALLFRKKIDRYCSYCQFAGKIDDETMVCQKYGLVPANHHCRKFRYDPLKRVPARPQKRPAEEKDYSL